MASMCGGRMGPGQAMRPMRFGSPETEALKVLFRCDFALFACRSVKWRGPTPAGAFKVRRVAVEMGASEEDRIVVRGDLKAGQRVVVGGNERLKEGQAVAFSPETQQRLLGH